MDGQIATPVIDRRPDGLRRDRGGAWEPHKYPSKASQDANLEMLIGWIREYETRSDVFSLAAHHALFDGFAGDKRELTSREAIAAFLE